MPEWVAVDVRNRSHAITVDVETPAGAVPNGTLLALGSALGGWSLHVLDGRLRYVHNLHGQHLYEVVGATALTPGRHLVEFRFDKDAGAGGTAELLVDGAAVGAAEVPRFTPVAFNEVGAGLTCGYEWGPVRRRGLRGAVPLQRHHRARRSDGDGPGRARPGGGCRRHPGLAVTSCHPRVRETRAFYVATTRFQPQPFRQLGHLGKVSPTASVTRSWSAQSLR